MPLKQDRTSYNISNNLKASMQAKGFNTNLVEGATYYDGGAAEIHLVLLMLPNGKFRRGISRHDCPHSRRRKQRKRV